MSGHSKWANIRIKKGKMDALRGKTFTKLTKEIIIAARDGGGNPETNLRLKKAVEKAKQNNLPKDNIEKGIKKGTGELPGVNYEAHTYEGYGSGGVAVLIDVLTDNKQRTIAEIRHIFTKHGGSMGEAGCVAWMFKRKGVLFVDKTSCDEETLFTLAIDAGAEDVKTEESSYEIYTEPHDFEKVKQSLQQNKISLTSAEVTMLPQNTVPVEGKEAEQVLKLMNDLEEHDDIQNVYANFDISEKVMEAVGV